MTGCHCCCTCTTFFLESEQKFELLCGPADNSWDVHENHFVCAECLGIRYAELGRNPQIRCPADGCNAVIVGHICHKTVKVSRSTRRGTTDCITTSKSDTVVIGKPVAEFDSNRHYVSQPVNWRKNHMMISLVFPTDVKNNVLTNDETQLITAAIPLNRWSESYNQSTQNKLVDIMKILFHVLKNEKFEDAAKVAEMMSAQEMISHALCDRSFFTRMIVALGSGQAVETLLDEKYGRNSYAQSTYLALWSAGEMLRRSMSECPGALQKLISKHCDVHKASKVPQELFCHLRISCSYQTTRFQKIKRVEMKLASGWDMSWRRWCILHVCFDNLGFKRRGLDCGYKQFTMLQLHTASIQLLKKLGFYLQRGSNKKPIDRTRTAWSEKKE